MEKVTALRGGEAGATMIEVLVTVIIVAIGLLALAAMQSRLQVSDLESYQRAQALVLIQDMAARMKANHFGTQNGQYRTGAIGTGGACPAVNAASTRAQLDLSQWCRSLQGAAERSGATDVGTMVGARGCIAAVPGSPVLNGNPTDYIVTIAWQGMIPISAPPASVTCGANQYDGGAGSNCTNDRCRRVVTTLVSIRL